MRVATSRPNHRSAELRAGGCARFAIQLSIKRTAERSCFMQWLAKAAWRSRKFRITGFISESATHDCFATASNRGHLYPGMRPVREYHDAGFMRLRLSARIPGPENSGVCRMLAA